MCLEVLGCWNCKGYCFVPVKVIDLILSYQGSGIAMQDWLSKYAFLTSRKKKPAQE